ncbi:MULTISPECIES: helix-turn-helix domain-containing protein [Pseudonocardia]|uniref:Helix-turn-helix domain protein n=2 Tax=Pseudonocardia TaxID=1847 RepID=A0A1Y2NA95_PSEAH|nr:MULTISPECIES: helix-turn-helix domain-containing protein [Pseudonocardia]OSY44151.1 Helix-turn-helix domain protein [Pseudonocardia autotrophica]TDN74119.1 AraC-like DNA-binding protein [Pseudonocardia autotrophica]BBG04877.1 hypothetical protein Pdca_60860 [Pseudonocardia autotrophica]GEC23533.1 hypothetical protein PSA01_05620 [Pseudonocardia saturnea]
MADGVPGTGVVRISFRSSEPAAVEQFAAEHYAATSVRPGESGRAFELGHDTLVVPGLELSQLWVTLGIDALMDPVQERYVVDTVCDGRMQWDTEAYGSIRLGAGDVALLPVRGRFRDVVEDIDLDVAALDARRVAAFAEQMHGIPAERFAVTGLLPVSGAAARWWDAVLVHVRDRVLGNPLLLDNPMVLDAAFHRLAVTFLATFPNTALDGEPERSRRPVPHLGRGVVARVVDYLHSHADLPIGPADLVRLTDMPARTALASLRRAGVDPALVLWHSRLYGARRDLLDDDRPDPARTAARWGFTHLGRFRVAYAQEFGETPEETARS